MCPMRICTAKPFFKRTVSKDWPHVLVVDCRVLTATKANKTERFIRSSALLDTKSTHSLNARSHCSVPVCPARTTAVRYALLLIQPLYTTFSLFLRTYTYINEDNANIILSFNLSNLRIQKCNQPSRCQMAIWLKFS